MNLRIFIVLFSLLCVSVALFYPLPVSASSITFENAPSTLSSIDDEYSVTITMSVDAKNDTVYYLRGVFYKPGSSNYCGYTWNGSEYFAGPYSSNEGWKKFLKITIQNNTWNGNLKAKIDSSDSGCKTSGNYNFKIQRFTESGSSAFDTQTEQVVQITVPTPTDTPTSTPKPTVTPSPSKSPSNTPTPPKPTSTPKQPTSSPKPSSSSNSSQITKTLVSNKTQIQENILASDTKEPSESAHEIVLGESTKSAEFKSKPEKDKASPSITPAVLGSTNSFIPSLFIALGIITGGIFGIIVYLKFFKKIDDEL